MRHSWLPLGLLLAAFLAFVGAAVGASRSLSELLARDAERGQAQQTRMELQRLLTLLVDVETGQRGFLITGQQAFLRPYEEALGEISEARSILRERIARSSANQLTLARLDALVDERLAQARTAVGRRLQGGEAATAGLASYVDGKRVMDELRYRIGELASEQQRAVALADQAVLAVQQRTTRLTRLLSAVGLATLTGAVALLLLERRRRDRAEAALRDANARLELQVAQRTDALSGALDRLRAFAIHMERGVDAERRRLAGEVHDQIGQRAIAMKMAIQTLRARLAPRDEPLVDELQAAAEASVLAARRIAAELRPAWLDELGLEAALAHFLQVLQRQRGLATLLTLSHAGVLPPEQAGPLFRILQEACAHVLRHPQASALRVAGRPVTLDEVPGYEIEVLDDRPGPALVRSDAPGLGHMRERAALAGGQLDFGPAAAGGARLRVWLPLRSPVPEEPGLVGVAD